MRIPTIPDWCKGLPDSTILYSCDILEFFRYNITNKKQNSQQANNFLRKGYLPKPKKIDFKLTGAANKRNKMWLLGDIRKLRIEMLSE